MRRPLLWVLPLTLGLIMLVLYARNDDAGINAVATQDFTVLVIKIGVVVLIGAAALTFFRDRFSQALESTLLWVVISLVLVLAYTFRFELRETGDRVLATIAPGRAAARSVELPRGRAGDFQLTTQVNGMKIPMVLDTGASAVVLTHDAAKAAGLPLEMLKYSVAIETANGHAQAAAVTLDRVAVGGLVERSVPALIAPPGQLKVSLLGMSFLNRLQSWEVRGSKLMMRGYP